MIIILTAVILTLYTLMVCVLWQKMKDADKDSWL